MRNVLGWIFAFVFVACTDKNLFADLLLQASSGTTIYSGGLAVSGNGVIVQTNSPDPGDWVFGINVWDSFSGRLYGVDPTPVGGKIWVSENGNINFSGDNSFSAVGKNIACISPLWDDFLYASNAMPPNRILVHTSPGEYIAATWENVRLFSDAPAGDPFPTSNRSTQVVWFEGDTTIKGFQFRTNDIAFSYQGRTAGTSDFGPIESFVGLSDGAGKRLAMPGSDSNGIITSGALLPWQDGSFVLFRPTADGSSYTLMVTAVPEPNSLWLSALLLGMLLPFRRELSARGGSRR
jgi:hypothetical protein